MKYLLFYLLLFSIIEACDPTNFELPAHQANVLMPLLDINLSMVNLILADTSEILQEDSTGLVSLVYQYSEKQKLKDILIVEDINADFTLPGINSDIADFYTEVPINARYLGIEEGFYESYPPTTFNYETEIDIDEFIQAEFKNGAIGLEITNELPFVLNAGANIELINKNEVTPLIAFSLESTINRGETLSLTDSDLTNKILTGSFTFRIKDLTTAGGNNITIEPDDNISAKLSFKNISFISAAIKKPTIELPSIKIDLPLEFSNGALISSARINKGTLSIDIPELNSAIRLQVTFLSILQNGIPVTIDLGENNTSISLEDMNIDLSTLTPAYNKLPIELQLFFEESAERISIEFEKPLDGSIGISNVDYSHLYGYLGKYNDVLKEEMELGFFKRIMSGSIIFYNPLIKITVDNGIGTTVKFIDDGNGLYITGNNKRLYGNKEVTIGSAIEKFSIKAAPAINESELSTLVLNEKTEPNFNEYMAILPSFVDFRIPYEMGTDELDFNQFIDAENELGIDIEIDLPLNLAIDHLYIRDTSAFAIQFDDSNREVQSGIFSANVESFYPVELNIQNYFLDENKEVIDSLFDYVKVIKPASIDENGQVIESFVAEYDISVDLEEMDRLRNTAYVVSSVRMHTPNADFVRLLSTYKVEYKLSGEIVTNIKLNQ